MQIWHVLENEEDVKSLMTGKKAELVGMFTNPQTFQPMHLYLVDWITIDGEMNKVKMAVPLTVVNMNFDASRNGNEDDKSV